MRRFFFLFFLFIYSFTLLRAQQYLDVTTQVGVSNTYGTDFFGGGVSFYDFDQDGWDDLSFATHSGQPIIFLKNFGGTFQEVSFPGITHTFNTKHLLWCDYDNDGDKDLFASASGAGNYLYVNLGGMNFVPYLLPAPAPFSNANSYGAAFGDYDLDGDLDLLVGNLEADLPISNQLWQNNGNGTFTDVTSNHTAIDTTYKPTFATGFIDYDNNSLPDIYTAEDRIFHNQLYRNMGNGQFEDDCILCGAEVVISAMCVTQGDFDNDGDLDIYVTNVHAGNVLLRNNGNGSFLEIAEQAGVSYNMVGWGSSFFDYDHDGDLDIYVSGATEFQSMKNVLYENNGNNTFSQPLDAGFIGDSTRSFSHAIGDLDQDGFYDIAVSNMIPDSFQVWKSTGGTNNWIKIGLQGVISNREGVGSWIEVWINGQKQVRYTHCGTGFLAQNPAYEIIGIGNEMLIDSIIIRWPSGVEDKMEDVQTNQFLSIIEGQTITSLEEIRFEKIMVSPNPVKDNVNIRFHADEFFGKDFILIDLGGKTWEEGRIPPKTDHNFQIDMSRFPPGLYIFRIFVEEKVFWTKIIKI